MGGEKTHQPVTSQVWSFYALGPLAVDPTTFPWSSGAIRDALDEAGFTNVGIMALWHLRVRGNVFDLVKAIWGGSRKTQV